MFFPVWLVFLLFRGGDGQGILYPRESETREVKLLNGIWNFVLLNSTEFLDNQIIYDRWKRGLKALTRNEILQMPVPSSYNDITTDPKIRDFVGRTLYQRTFYVSRAWADGRRVWLRFDSVYLSAQVYLNGKFVAFHDTAHLPFEVDVTKDLHYSRQNTIFVVCNNTLNAGTIPPGDVHQENGVTVLQYDFDYFNYAGINRPVKLYTTPSSYITDVNITSTLKGNTATVNYSITTGGPKDVKMIVVLHDKENAPVKNAKMSSGSIVITNPKLWWPYLMNDNAGYMYKLQIELRHSSTQKLIDKYVQPFGIRQLTWNYTTLMINNKPLYLRGFGKHEDSDIRGKGLDLPLILRDYNLIKWIGANAFRTTHYPYAEEIMDLADEYGIMVISECPAIELLTYSPTLLQNHLKSLSELYRRDKNRPGTIMWSLANEPLTSAPGGEEHFKTVAQYMKSLDPTRPLTISLSEDMDSVKSMNYLDIISVNRYYGWYVNSGITHKIHSLVKSEVSDWHKKFYKPIIYSEYGAATLPGMHSLPATIWTEDYQIKCMSEHFKAFDRLRKKSYLIGEFVWNFADFNTAQSVGRAGGNKKGIFTRNRQPKAGAYHLRKRYWYLAKLTNERVLLPTDLDNYILE